MPGDDPVVVLSHDYWQRRFAGDPSVVGRTMVINGAPLTIIGVAQRGFSGDIVGQPIEVFIPLMMQPSVMPNTGWLDDRTTCWLLLMGRLKPGVSLAQAKAEFTTLVTRSLLDHATAAQVQRLETNLREQPPMISAGAQGFSYYRREYARALAILMGAVGLVLLVVCANVANLMLARASARGREMSVRMALGAGRLRLVQQLLTEALLLASGGAVLGLGVAVWGSRQLLRMAGAGRGGAVLDLALDGRILAFTAGLALLTAVLFGLVPAIRGTRVQLATALRAQGRDVAGAGGGGRLGLGKVLVVAQVALSLLLLVGTGMLVRSLTRLSTADLGLARDQVVVADIDPTVAGYAGSRLAQLRRDLADRIARVPGVAAVSYSENGLFSGTESGSYITVPGFTASAASDTIIAYDDVGPGYFDAVGARLLLGRGIEARDGPAGAAAAVVNQGMAQFYFGATSPIGRQVHLDDRWYEIVGVVADIKDHEVRGEAERRMYIAMEQLDQPPGAVPLRGADHRRPDPGPRAPAPGGSRRRSHDRDRECRIAQRPDQRVPDRGPAGDPGHRRVRRDRPRTRGAGSLWGDGLCHGSPLQ